MRIVVESGLIEATSRMIARVVLERYGRCVGSEVKSSDDDSYGPIAMIRSGRWEAERRLSNARSKMIADIVIRQQMTGKQGW